ncbi:MAG: helix-turn-helix transcriptional regulator [Peptococcaceae bacterium]|nr:helix-turn-helix transcriptional regulator [Peptococcaceae bacterium]
MNTRIKQRRKELKITQVELAKRIGVTQGAISAIERGDCDPTTTTIGSIAKTLNVSVDWLIFGKEFKKDENSEEELAGIRNKPPNLNFSDQQLELLELTKNMTEQQQVELLGAVKMFLINQKTYT